MSEQFWLLTYHYHTGYLAKRCDHDHPIWRTRTFVRRGLINSLNGKALVGHGHCKETNMYAEGIPAVIQVSREVRTAAKEHHDKVNEIFLKLQNMTSNITQQNDSLTQFNQT